MRQGETADHAVEQMNRTRSKPTRTAHRITAIAGSVWTAAVAAALVGVWLVVGALSDAPRWWEMIGTCGVPMFTLALVLVLQHTENHNNRALQVKLDEIIRALSGTNDEMMQVEDADERDLESLQDHFADRAQQAASRRETTRVD